MNDEIFKSILKINKLSIRARYVVEGFISGMHASPFKGHSLEFAQHREYSPPDELKYIDWKVYGRSDKFFIKQFMEETNLRAFIMLDSSMSMSFKAENDIFSKLEYAKHITAILTYFLLRQKDSVGLVTFDEDIIKFIPSMANFSHFSTITEILEQTEPRGKTNIITVCSDFSKYLKKRCLIILLSDLFDEPLDLIKIMKQFRFRHHDIIVFQIISSAEMNFPYKGPSLFEFYEEDTKIKCEPELIQKEYNKIFNKFLENYKIAFQQSGIDYCLLTTDTPFETGLGNFLSFRSRKQ